MTNAVNDLSVNEQQFVDSLNDQPRGVVALMVTKRYGGVVMQEVLWPVGQTRGSADSVVNALQWARGLVASLEALAEKPQA